MLNSVLLVGVPMAALLVAALYIYSKTQPQTNRGGGGSGFRREPWGTAQSDRPPSATTRRRRNRQGADGGNNNGQSSVDSPDSGYADGDQCEICFEDMRAVTKVRLYPCNHSDICQTCVNKLLISNRRQCPFCRARIDGFYDVDSGALFG